MHPIVAQSKPSPEQQPAITARNNDVVVTAGAGAGKTRTLVARYLSLLADGLEPQEIAAITFTRKAAREMRNRVRKAINRYLSELAEASAERSKWETLYVQLDAARIGTIHSLFAEILRAHPAEAALDPRFTLLEEAGAALLKSQAVEAALAWIANDRDRVRLFTLFGERDLRRILELLLNRRLEATELFQDFANAPLRRWEIELRKRQSARLDQLMCSPHWCDHVAVLQENQALDGDDKLEQERTDVLDATAEALRTEEWASKYRILSRLDKINLQGGSQKAWTGGKAQRNEVKQALHGLRDLWRKEEKFQCLELNEADVLFAGALPLLRDAFEYARQAYAHLREQRSALDFDDLEAQALSLLKANRAVRSRWQSEIRAILVDEYQDTNGRQRDLINLLNGDGQKLFIVGDAKQSIYRFRGADVTVFRQEREHIATRGRAFTLSTSYRAHRDLMLLLNAMLEPVLGTPESGVDPWQEPFAELRHHREQPEAELRAPFVELHLVLGTKADGGLEHAAHALAGRIATLVESQETKLRYEDIAILCRASTSFAAYESALDALGIPYLTVSGQGFYERPEIRDLLNALRALADPSDDLALVGLLRSPVIGFSDFEIYHICRQQRVLRSPTLWETVRTSDNPKCVSAAYFINEINARAGRVTVADLLKAFLDATSYRAALRRAGQRRALRNVSKLLELAHSSGNVLVDDFLEYVEAVRTRASREGEARATAENAVQIMSVHQAKGLEFPVVVLGDATYGAPSRAPVLLDSELGILAQATFELKEKPASWLAALEREKSQEEAESQRLLYVAATRARDKLLINGCVTLNKKNHLTNLQGWLKEFCKALPLEEQECHWDLEGQEIHTFEFLVANSTARCHVYEPGYRVTRVAVSTIDAPTPSYDQWSPQMLKNLQRIGRNQLAEEAKLWRVVPDARHLDLPAHLVGDLVHEALALWRFPDGERSGFTQWLKARARQRGIVSSAHLEEVVSRVGRLLARFRRHPFYRTLEQAERRLHEVPFVINSADGMERGQIDLLFLQGGDWTLVEFKTEAIGDEEQLQQLLNDGVYLQAIRRDRVAVQELLGVSPRALLCLLDYGGAVKTLDLDVDV